jgi:hypothetical protein
MGMKNTAILNEPPKTYFTLEELKEMHRDMESIAQLTESIAPERKTKRASNIYLFRPDIKLPQL